MAGPLIAEASPPTVYSTPLTVATGMVRNGMPSCVPTVSMIVPISSEQKQALRHRAERVNAVAPD